ncbi:MAG: acetyl-CoA carboxylase biotin carboxyl carrier protein [Acidobacteria bacterium]|nr:acetyl-CoA carboxylase biotin carboxyl carrier protein [Acidobacteriota bacterium]
MEAFHKNGLSEFEFAAQDFNLKLKKEVGGSNPVVAGSPIPGRFQAPPAPVVPSEVPVEGEGADEISLDNLEIIESPIIGTFYRSPNPDSEPYISVGDVIRKGQVLCIIEAMKIMNEIESEIEGTVVKIFPKNAEAVEFGQKLFAVKPV